VRGECELVDDEVEVEVEEDGFQWDDYLLEDIDFL
jgi:hypothetical protein